MAKGKLFLKSNSLQKKIIAEFLARLTVDIFSEEGRNVHVRECSDSVIRFKVLKFLTLLSWKKEADLVKFEDFAEMSLTLKPDDSTVCSFSCKYQMER